MRTRAASWALPIGHSPASPPAAPFARARKTKNSANPTPLTTASPTSRPVTTETTPGRGGARLTRAIATSAQVMPTSGRAPGRSPEARPTTTGMTADVTDVIGATTVMAPAESAR